MKRAFLILLLMGSPIKFVPETIDFVTDTFVARVMAPVALGAAIATSAAMYKAL